jgi:hypothetical protein
MMQHPQSTHPHSPPPLFPIAAATRVASSGMALGAKSHQSWIYNQHHARREKREKQNKDRKVFTKRKCGVKREREEKATKGKQMTSQPAHDLGRRAKERKVKRGTCGVVCDKETR